MFEPRYLKEGKMLCKGVKKFVRYKRDLISDERMGMIDAAYAEFEQALKDRDPEKADQKAKRLTDVCEKSVKDYRSSAWAENVEVIFVAVVIALGVRAYFLQPFKIPTGSMQPTLNGVVAHPAEEEGDNFSTPGVVVKLWDKVMRGRTWVDAVATGNDEVVKIEQSTRMKFFTSTKLVCKSGKTYSIPAAVDKVMELGNRGFFGQFGELRPGTEAFRENNPSGRAQRILVPPSRQRGIPGTVPITEGEVLARGFVDTGDQVLVDKMSYHFRRPKRGEVFVFTTKNLPIRMENPDFGSQHYIKRLVGIPGDDIRVSAPKLYINGEEAAEPGMQRVMSQEDGYKGYTNSGNKLTYELGELDFWAMGDNSGNSSDSRVWGAVPRENLVGPALVVYWPFTSHWGRIR